ncbi:Rossmann-fold NAD(P)-binding domain-containing protein [Haloplanus natans]|uniref:hypothetical protein n=1 Tax=Haloplanus natans TaxID=376171 RepID=UPI0006781ED0|nr:hypothetical protein [Haloplanus natans]
MSERQPVELRFLSQEATLDAGIVEMDRCVETMASVFDLYNRGQVLMGNPGEHMHGHVTTFPGNLENADTFDADRIFCDVRGNALEFAERVDWEVMNRLGAAVDYGLGLDIDRTDLRTLHELVGGADTAPTEGRSTLYSPGLPMEDVAWTNEVYENAKAAGLGRTPTMFEEPYFTKPY